MSDQCEVFSSSLTLLVSHNQPRICCAFGQFTDNLGADEEHDKNLVRIDWDDCFRLQTMIPDHRVSM